MIELRVNTLTALPALQYMLADAGLEAPHFAFRPGWEAFQRFLALPSGASGGVGGFQAPWGRDNALDPVFEVRLCRQVTDAKSSFGTTTRVIGVEFRFEGAPDGMEEVELWANDSPTLAQFIATVERTREFQYARGGRVIEAEAIVLDEGDPQELPGHLRR